MVHKRPQQPSKEEKKARELTNEASWRGLWRALFFLAFVIWGGFGLQILQSDDGFVEFVQWFPLSMVFLVLAYCYWQDVGSMWLHFAMGAGGIFTAAGLVRNYQTALSYFGDIYLFGTAVLGLVVIGVISLIMGLTRWDYRNK